MTRLFVSLQSYFADIETRVQGRDDRGATMVEYALIVGGIAIIITGLLAAFGGKISAAFNKILP
ncbi:MAG: Flp family type IVb pilin [Actinomycetota bacterium]